MTTVFDIGYWAGIILHLSEGALKHLTQELLLFFNGSNHSAKDYKTKLLSFTKCKSVLGLITPDNLGGLILKNTFKIYQSLHRIDEEYKFFMGIFAEAFKKQLIMDKAQHVVTKMTFFDAVSDPTSQNLSQVAVNKMNTTYFL